MNMLAVDAFKQLGAKSENIFRFWKWYIKIIVLFTFSILLFSSNSPKLTSKHVLKLILIILQPLLHALLAHFVLFPVVLTSFPKRLAYFGIAMRRVRLIGCCGRVGDARFLVIGGKYPIFLCLSALTPVAYFQVKARFSPSLISHWNS